MSSWNTKEAKKKLERVIELVISDSPQRITRNGETVAYIISAETFADKTKPSIKSVLLNQPHKDVDISWERNTHPSI